MPVILFSGGILGPDSISGLQGWWDASSGVFSDAGSTPAVDTNTVQQWNDRSGNGRNLSQSTAGNRPTYRTGILNGQSVIRFGGGTDDDYMSNATALSSFFAVGAKTAFVVFKHTANATTTLWADTTDQVINYVATTGTILVAHNNDGSIDTANKGGLSSGTYYIGTYLHSGGNILSGASDTRTASLTSTASGNTSSLSGTLLVGQNSSTNFLDGDIAEIIFYNVALSEADRQTVERYCAAKYGITLPY